tara:strand:- start:77 stop:289 length:213 start_codon:yes stop_codon:yes gene_type:complete
MFILLLVGCGWTIATLSKLTTLNHRVDRKGNPPITFLQMSGHFLQQGAVTGQNFATKGKAEKFMAKQGAE